MLTIHPERPLYGWLACVFRLCVGTSLDVERDAGTTVDLYTGIETWPVPSGHATSNLLAGEGPAGQLPLLGPPSHRGDIVTGEGFLTAKALERMDRWAGDLRSFRVARGSSTSGPCAN